jgi:leucyl-tRNA synthetase
LLKAIEGEITAPDFDAQVHISSLFVSKNLIRNMPVTALHVDVNLVDNDVLDIEALRKQRPDFAEATFLLEEGKYVCGAEIEKCQSRSLM